MTKTASIQTIIIAVFLSIAVFVTLGAVAPANVSAQTKEDVCEGLEFTGSECENLPASCTDGNPATSPNPGDAGCEGAESGLSSLIATVLNILSIVVGVVSVIMIIIGGFKYIISGGESAQTASAKNTIIFALVGLVIVAFAQVIVQFVLGRI